MVNLGSLWLRICLNRVLTSVYCCVVDVQRSFTRAFSQSVAPARSALSQLMGAEVGARGASAASRPAAAAPSNIVEAFFAAKPHPTGHKIDYKAFITNSTAKSVAADLTNTFPNTFETILAKKL